MCRQPFTRDPFLPTPHLDQAVDLSFDRLLFEHLLEILPGDLYNFGFLDVGSSSTVIFTIENPGDAPFTLHSIDLASAQFSVNTANAFPFTIEPNTLITFDLTFTPTEAGMYIADISIPNPSPGEDPYTFVVTGGEVFVAQRKEPGLEQLWQVRSPVALIVRR